MDGRDVKLARMFGWVARAALLRFLPRRLLPLLAAFELFRLVRSVRTRKQPVNVNEPSRSRTSPPPRINPPARR